MGKYFKKNLSIDKKNIISNSINTDKNKDIESILNKTISEIEQNNNININHNNNETYIETTDSKPTQLPKNNPLLLDIYQILMDVRFELHNLKKEIFSIKEEIMELKNQKPIKLEQTKETNQENISFQKSYSTNTIQNQINKTKQQHIPNQETKIIKTENKLEKIVTELEKKEKLTKSDIEKYLNKLNSEKISEKELQEFVRNHPLEEIFPNRPKEAYKEAYKTIFKN